MSYLQIGFLRLFTAIQAKCTTSQHVFQHFFLEKNRLKKR